jgi:hypothetical protein
MIMVTRDELKAVVAEMEELRVSHNANAAVLNLHRYLLDRFIPAGLLEAACNDWYKIQQEEIEKERAKAHGVPAQA